VKEKKERQAKKRFDNPWVQTFGDPGQRRLKHTNMKAKIVAGQAKAKHQKKQRGGAEENEKKGGGRAHSGRKTALIKWVRKPV